MAVIFVYTNLKCDEKLFGCRCIKIPLQLSLLSNADQVFKEPAGIGFEFISGLIELIVISVAVSI